MLPNVAEVEIGLKEGGTRCRSLSVRIEGILSTEASVCRLDNDVDNGKNGCTEVKRSMFSLDVINWSVGSIRVDRV